MLLAALAALVLVLTAINVYEIVKLSGQNTELSTRVDRDRSEAQRLTNEAGGIRRAINQDELQLVVDAAREANSIIDQRTFSWTQFFNVLEENMPPDVMLSAVQPTVSAEGTQVSMVVLGRRSEDIQEFIEKLEASGAFEEVLPTQQDRTDEGVYRVVLDSTYTGAHESPAAPDEPEKKPPQGDARKTGGPQ